jgi:hypothetical protein
MTGQFGPDLPAPLPPAMREGSEGLKNSRPKIESVIGA